MTNAAGTRRKKAVIAPKKKEIVACHEIGHALVVGTVKAAHQKALNILRERAHRKRRSSSRCLMPGEDNASPGIFTQAVDFLTDFW